jgi:hypothetical protein
MQGESNPREKDFPESEKGFEQPRDKQGQGTGPGQNRPPQDRGSTGTVTGTATETAPQDPGTTEPQSTTDKPIRNPSGDDLSQGIEGDEGPGRGIL